MNINFKTSRYNEYKKKMLENMDNQKNKDESKHRNKIFFSN